MRNDNNTITMTRLDRTRPPPTVPTSGNTCLDVFSNVRVCTKIMPLGHRKLSETGEPFVRGSFAEFYHREVTDYVENP